MQIVSGICHTLFIYCLTLWQEAEFLVSYISLKKEFFFCVCCVYILPVKCFSIFIDFMHIIWSILKNNIFIPGLIL